MKKFIAGLIIGATLMSSMAFAADSKIEVLFQPLKYYFDGVQKTTPADQAGFVYKGTTYVPLRFVAEALDKEVQWDGKTYSIYVGKQPEGAAVKVKDTVGYENGTYRGAFLDSGSMQVNVQFKLEDNIIKEVSFRHLEYKGVNYLKEQENKTIIGLKDQYQQLANHLIGKDIRKNIVDLYKPGEIVTNKVDTFTGATLRSSKIVSAVRDGLNRGVYSY